MAPQKPSDLRVAPYGFRLGADPDPAREPLTGEEIVPAWEEIEIGRYRPRRIRGSFPGRELG